MILAPAATAATSVSYPENGMDPVATFSATDQDGDAIEWSLSGPDEGDFTIDGGVLAFKDSPNYEDPKSASTGTLADRNVYNVTVEATGGSEDVTVTVTDVDEDGSASLSQYQPQVGRPLLASASDPDNPVSGTKWQWSRGESADGPWTDIDKATSASRPPVAADDGMYLRATATYADKFGSGKTASVVSDNAVEDRTVANAAPSFEDQENDDGNVVRMVDENTAVGAAIGAPLTATDADGDVLIYSIVADADDTDTTDDEYFSIDRATGQLKVKVKVNYESTGGATATDNCNDANECTVTVRATDPSTVDTDQVVMVNVMDVNEAPAYTADSDDATDGVQGPPTALTVAEEPDEDSPDKQLLKPDGGDDDDPPAPDNLDAGDYVAVDPDDPPGDASTEAVTYDLAGADEAKFSISTAGALTVATDHTPDFEKQSSYSITIVATSGAGDRTLRTRLDVTVKVTDAEDAGTVTLSQIGPQVGVPVVATLSDKDGGETISTWQWSHGISGTECPAADGTWTAIPGATSGSYTPKDFTVDGTETEIIGQCLRATATYKDDFGTGDDAPAHGISGAAVQDSHADNSAPKFADQDLTTPGEQSDETSRSVEENTKADQPIGAAVGAEDGDSSTEGRMDLLLYTLGGPDMASFGIDRKTGQINTKAALDFEDPSDVGGTAGDNVYVVTVTATDPSGAYDMITVNITVTNGPDNAVITVDSDAFDYAENGMDPVATFSATDQDGDAIVWSLSGPDEGDFTIDGGVLAFKDSPNYEDPKSASTGTLADRNMYNVTVEATGGSEDVTVTVTDVDEDGSASLSQYQPQVGRPLLASASDPDNPVSGTKWQWSRGESADGPWTDIDKATSASRPPVAADANMYLRATATYTDKFGSGKTASVVSDDAVEGRTLANAAPSFEDQENDDGNVVRMVDENTAVGAAIGAPLTATDADGDVLIYSIVADADDTDTSDDEYFSIDRATGQLKVKVKLNFESAGGATATDNCNDANECTVTVRATDPSTVDTDQVVMVNVMDVNEAPAYTADSDDATDGVQGPPTALTVAEEPDEDSPDKQLLKPDGGDDDDPPAPDNLDAGDYVAVDPDDPPGDASTEAVTYDLAGADEAKFSISTAGALTVATDHTPDFEKQSSYSITIVATSGAGDRTLRTRLDVTVKVTDAEDAGTVTLSQIGPQVGVPVVATLSDKDGGETISTWQWSHGISGTECPAADGTWTAIPGATSGSYTPKDFTVDGTETEIIGQCLRATATYKDDFGTGDDAPAHGISGAAVQDSHADNSAPKFADQDLTTPGEQSDETSRSVEENTKADQPIGAAVGASDPDSSTEGRMDLLLYTLGGPDMASFGIDRKTGQVMTKAVLDYEDPSDVGGTAGDNVYVVTVTATDPSGATDMITVMITVTNGPDDATIALNTPPAFAEDMAERMVEENMPAGADVGDPVTASDADGDTLTYKLTGDDNFTIDSESGQITTTALLDYDMMASHMVTVTADDGRGSTDSIDVTITVIPSNTPPAFTAATATRSVEENLDAGAPVGDPVTAMDNDVGDTVTYSLEGSGYFTIDMATGQINTTMMLDHEAMSTHSVTVTATDEDGETDTVVVTINVDNAHTGCDTAGNHGLVNDCEALLDSEDALGGSLNWTDDTAMSDWDGVTISDGRVTAINLRDQDLDGTVPATLGRVSMLTSLNLKGNDLTGGIPASLNYLSNLTVLNLHSNNLSGEIPDLGMTSLQELYLNNNYDEDVADSGLSGEVPDWLNDMTDMTELWLWGNMLTGALPDLSGMMSLERLKLNGNMVSGFDAAMLPSGLRWLIIGETDMGSTAPDLSSLMSLTTLWMNENGLTDAVPVANIPTSVTSLNLKGNMLSGTIPDMSSLTNLEYLRLHRNELSGDIPGTLGDLDSIERIWLYENDLTGIAEGFGNAADTLTHLELRGNDFAEGTCLPGGLDMVANNDFETAGPDGGQLAACGDGS